MVKVPFIVKCADLLHPFSEHFDYCRRIAATKSGIGFKPIKGGISEARIHFTTRL
ncbi:MAG: hypothetical protein OJF47_002618 [Nitrospira sp.]|nr:MAG: hypothetical protein OJF47_002618 [Nitrospira sp.]